MDRFHDSGLQSRFVRAAERRGDAVHEGVKTFPVIPSRSGHIRADILAIQGEDFRDDCLLFSIGKKFR